MKDLTKVNYNGESKSEDKDKQNVYYYMNHFLGIDKSCRPVTVFMISYNNKMVLMVPAINSNYTHDNYQFQLHTIKTRNQNLDRTKFVGVVRIRIYAWN